MMAAAVLRNTNQRVRLVIGRNRNQASPDPTLATSPGAHHGNTFTMETKSKMEPASPNISDKGVVVNSDDSAYGK